MSPDYHLDDIDGGIRHQIKKKNPDFPQFNVRSHLTYGRTGHWRLCCNFVVDAKNYPQAPATSLSPSDSPVRIYDFVQNTEVTEKEASFYKLLEACFLRSLFHRLENEITKTIRELISDSVATDTGRTGDQGSPAAADTATPARGQSEEGTEAAD